MSDHINIDKVMEALRLAFWEQRGDSLQINISPPESPNGLRVGGVIDCELLGRSVFKQLGLKESPPEVPTEDPTIVIEEN
jgi:hypothetical protein